MMMREANLQSFDSSNIDDITTVFRDYLDSLDYYSIEVSAAIDVTFGTYVKFTDVEGDSVTILFTMIQGYPSAMVVSAEDEQIEIDLSGSSPPITSSGLIDLRDLSWLNKSVIDALLQAGQVNEDETYVLKGGVRVKLPVVRRRSSMTDKEKSATNMAKSLTWSDSKSSRGVDDDSSTAVPPKSR